MYKWIYFFLSHLSCIALKVDGSFETRPNLCGCPRCVTLLTNFQLFDTHVCRNGWDFFRYSKFDVNFGNIIRKYLTGSLIAGPVNRRVRFHIRSATISVQAGRLSSFALFVLAYARERGFLNSSWRIALILVMHCNFSSALLSRNDMKVFEVLVC